MKKRLFTLLIAVIFCVVGFGLEPLSALAASGEDTPDTGEETKPVYTITYDLNGRDYRGNLTPVTYTQGEEVSLPIGRYISSGAEEYLDGWYETPDCSGERVEKINAEDAGDKVYYAK